MESDSAGEKVLEGFNLIQQNYLVPVPSMGSFTTPSLGTTVCLELSTVLNSPEFAP